jgi:hypothetical protein
MIRSSYIENDYGSLIQEYIKAWQPASLVELGVLDGYSTLHIAKGIEWLYKMRRFAPKFDSYDLFEDYEFKHGSKEEVEKLLQEHNVAQFVNLQKGSAYEVHKNYPDVKYDERGEQIERGIEFLHIDISNTGDTLRNIMELWHPKIGWRGIILIEGGSEERDNVEWMRKYNAPSIKKEIETNPIINKYYHYGTYLRYPSMTVMLRKWWNVK